MTIKADAGKSTRMHLSSRGDIFFHEENWIAALESYAQAAEQDPSDADMRYKCGVTLEKLGMKDAALEQYEQVFTLNPKHVDTLRRVALEALIQEEWEDCLTLCGEMLEIDPDHVETLHLAARALEGRGEPEAARVYLDRLFRIQHDHPPAAALSNRIQKRHAPRTESPAIEAMHGNRDITLNIAMLWGGTPFSGNTLRDSPLGGTETGIVHMARSLAQTGHSVVVYVVGGHGICDGVRYADAQRYAEDLKTEPADILIAARTFHPFQHDMDARLKILWTGDAHDQPFAAPLSDPSLVDGIDAIFTVSKWQTDMLLRKFNIPEEKFYITRNGVYWDDFEQLPASRNRSTLIYTSTPFRGLEVLMDVFPEIRKRVPDARLDVYSSMAVYGMDREADTALYGSVYQKTDQPRVSWKGSVVQKELAGALKTAGVFAYPNHFAETSCIAAMEAMAAGLPVVTSRLGALPETVADGGVLISGDPTSEAYRNEFVDRVCGLLTDTNLWNRMSIAGRNRIDAHNRWEVIAAEWVDKFHGLLNH